MEQDRSKPGTLFIRTDRLGDFLLTLPAFGAVKAGDPDRRTVAYVRDYVAPVARMAQDIDEVVVAPAQMMRRGERRDEARRIAALHCDTAVAFWQDPQTAEAVWRAGLKRRATPVRHWQDFLFSNKRIYQRRSRCAMSEWEYNVELCRAVHPLGEPRVRLRVSERLSEKIRPLICGLGAYIVIHPGMGGSALNWPRQNYSKLAQTIAESLRRNVLVTGGRGEEDLACAVAAEARSKKVWPLIGLTLEELAQIHAGAALFFGPSTGPLHLAASLGRPAVGLYSPVRVHGPKRWRVFEPLGRENERFTALRPSVPEIENAENAPPDVMESVSPAQAVAAIEALLERTSA